MQKVHLSSVPPQNNTPPINRYLWSKWDRKRRSGWFVAKKTPPDTHFVITMTSRAPRVDETHGVDYFFVDRETFEDHIAKDELLEYAKVYSDYKGIPPSRRCAKLLRRARMLLCGSTCKAR